MLKNFQRMVIILIITHCHIYSDNSNSRTSDEIYGKFNWKKGDSWICSVYVYNKDRSHFIARLKKPEYVPRIDYSYQLKIGVDEDSINNIKCWKLHIFPSIIKKNFIDTATFWVNVKDGGVLKTRSNIRIYLNEVKINKNIICKMISFGPTLMPISFIPWGYEENIDIVNRHFNKPDVVEFRESNGIKCEDFLRMEKINRNEINIKLLLNTINCLVVHKVEQVWSIKYGWWKKYVKYDRENVHIFGKLISKNGKKVASE